MIVRPTEVVNIHRAVRYVEQAKMEGRYVYIGRPSKWGNRFKVCNRDEAIARHAKWVHAHPELWSTIVAELRGKVLGCYCSPKRCHGDILARIADGFESVSPER